jgi:hypothetical protein
MSIIQEALRAIQGENNLAGTPFLNEPSSLTPKDAGLIIRLSNLSTTPKDTTRLHAIQAKCVSGRQLTIAEQDILALYNREPGF